MGGGGVRHKVLFRAGWKHMFCIPDFGNVSPGDGLDWVKETHCAVKTEWKPIFFWFYDFLLSVLLFIIFYVLNLFKIAK